MLCKKVDNIIATIDLNGKQIDGSTDEVLAMGSTVLSLKL
jgi:transketolase